MNYLKIYNQLVEKRKLNPPTEYFEKHHIKPRSLFPELAKDKENIVKLTYREHYIAHWLLTKIYKDNSKMIFAFWLMNIMDDDLYENSLGYEIARKKYISKRKCKQFTLEHRKKLSENNVGMKGKKHSLETKLKMSKVMKGKNKGNKHMLGKHHTAESNEKNRKAHLGKGCKRIRCIELNKEYNSEKDAINELNLTGSSLSMTLKGRQHTTGGYHFEYI